MEFLKGLPPVDSSKRLIALRALSIEELQRLYSFRPKISPPDPGQIPQLLRTTQDAQAAFVALFRSRKLLAGTLGFTDFRELLLDVPAEDIPAAVGERLPPQSSSATRIAAIPTSGATRSHSHYRQDGARLGGMRRSAALEGTNSKSGCIEDVGRCT